MTMRIALVTLLVPDYDEGIAFYKDKLGFHLREDKDMGKGKRWVVVSPTPSEHDVAFLLAKASDEKQLAAVGNQTGGRVSFFLFTSDFDATFARFNAAGVTFCEEKPRREVYGSVIVFADPWGNKFDLMQPAESPRTS
jgi:catechol 2,3-dioxygenase-like lactoylglutathione lyase family enzyme